MQFSGIRAKVYLENKLLGFAVPEAAITIKPTSSQLSGTLLFEMLLTSQVIETIEKIRGGGNLVFNLNVIGEYQDSQNRLSDSDSIKYYVNQKSWIDALKQMGYGNTLLFELPIDLEPNEAVSTAILALEDARAHLYYGQYDQVVAQCRLALDSVKPKQSDLNAALHGLKNNKDKMTKYQRVINIYHAVRHLTHLAHHLNNDNECVSFTRNEAIMVLGATSALIVVVCNQGQ